MAHLRLGDGDPRVVVAENAAVLLIAGRVAGHLAELLVVLGVGRLENHDAVLGVQQALDRRQGLLGMAVGQTNPS